MPALADQISNLVKFVQSLLILFRIKQCTKRFYCYSVGRPNLGTCRIIGSGYIITQQFTLRTKSFANRVSCADIAQYPLDRIRRKLRTFSEITAFVFATFSKKCSDAVNPQSIQLVEGRVIL